MNKIVFLGLFCLDICLTPRGALLAQASSPAAQQPVPGVQQPDPTVQQPDPTVQQPDPSAQPSDSLTAPAPEAPQAPLNSTPSAEAAPAASPLPSAASPTAAPVAKDTTAGIGKSAVLSTNPPVNVVNGPRKNLVLLGPGFSFGFFYPKDVNAIIEDWQDSQGATAEQSGFTGMVLNIVPRLAVAYAPIEYVQVQAVGELGWGPKILTVINGDSESFHFMRYSVGGTVAGYLPFRKYRNSIFFGGGVLYHWMSFEDYQASSLGYRGLAGVRFYLKRKRFVPEVFIAFDYAKASTSKSLVNGTTNIHNIDLNYTGVMIGGNFYFNLTGRL